MFVSYVFVVSRMTTDMVQHGHLHVYLVQLLEKFVMELTSAPPMVYIQSS